MVTQRESRPPPAEGQSRSRRAAENRAARHVMQRAGPIIIAGIVGGIFSVYLAFWFPAGSAHPRTDFVESIRRLEINGSALEAMPAHVLVQDVLSAQRCADLVEEGLAHRFIPETALDNGARSGAPKESWLCSDAHGKPCKSSHFSKVTQLLFSVAQKQNGQVWGITSLLQKNVLLDLKLVEYEHGAHQNWRIGSGPHYEGCSYPKTHTRLLTISVTLSLSGSFSGGDLQVGAATTNCDVGTAIIYISGTPHCVHPVVQGVRRKLVLAVWRNAPYSHPVLGSYRARLIEPQLLNLGGRVIRALKRKDASVASAVSAMSGEQDDPDNLAHWALLLGECLLATGAVEEALPWFDRAMQLNGTNPHLKIRKLACVKAVHVQRAERSIEAPVPKHGDL